MPNSSVIALPMSPPGPTTCRRAAPTKPLYAAADPLILIPSLTCSACPGQQRAGWVSSSGRLLLQRRGWLRCSLSSLQSPYNLPTSLHDSPPSLGSHARKPEAVAAPFAPLPYPESPLADAVSLQWKPLLCACSSAPVIFITATCSVRSFSDAWSLTSSDPSFQPDLC